MPGPRRLGEHTNVDVMDVIVEVVIGAVCAITIFGAVRDICPNTSITVNVGSVIFLAVIHDVFLKKSLEFRIIRLGHNNIHLAV